MKKKSISLILLLCSLVVMAEERTTEQKIAIAESALGAYQAKASAVRKLPQTGLKELRRLHSCSLVGYDGGAFVVIPDNAAEPSVVGISYNATKGDNPGFEWWLAAMDDVLSGESATTSKKAPIPPDPKRFASSVEPMLTTSWGQGDPFYRLCPLHPDDGHCATGCVATAMAQVLNYHKLPVRGLGMNTVYYPFGDANGEAVFANFSETFYEWDRMLDRYDEGKFSEEEANAVATLMMHCGVAANMQYGGYNHGGSATTSMAAADGLRMYFGFEDAQSLSRTNYSDEEWMDIVFAELSGGNPLVYGGQNTGGNGGHSFVLTGYDEDGLVYVNWGWLGDAEGYYDISKLNPRGYHFSARQDMIVGVSGKKAEVQAFEVELSEPGQLAALMPANADSVCGALKVKGQINSSDLRFIRSLAGRDTYGEAKIGYLKDLDLSEAVFVAGGEPFLIEGDKEYTTAEGTLPAKAFYDCRTLVTLKLPANIHTFGDGALGGCYVLQSVEWEEPAEKDYVREGDLIMNIGQTELIAVLPTAMGRCSLPATIVNIHPLAVSGCVGLSAIDIPASVSDIGGEALRNCVSLMELRIHGKQQPTLSGYNVFAGVRTDVCKLYIPSGTKLQYTNKAQWKDFGKNIIEYGTTIRANNLDRDYGEENPRLGYRIEGTSVSGKPELWTDATVFSLPGDYTIYIAPGTIEGEDVEFVNGTLTIYPAILTAKAADCARRQGEDNPEFTIIYDGFVNGEDASILQVQPTATTTATKDSPEGQYPIKVSGGSSDRYEFHYVAGTLTISNNLPGGITDVTASASAQGLLRTLDGRVASDALRKGIYVRGGRKIVVR